jgi:hypothetical protein
MYSKSGHLFIVASSLAAFICAAPGVSHAEEIYAPVSTATSTTSPVTTIGVMEHFGKRGQVFLGGASSVNLGLFHAPALGTAAGVNLYQFGLNPRAGVFLQDFLFVQLGLGFNYATSVASNKLPAAASYYTMGFELKPGIGLNVPLNALVSFAPSLNLDYGYTRISTPLPNSGSTASSFQTLSIGLDAPFVFEVAKHVSLTAGPSFYQNIMNKDQTGATGVHTNNVALSAGVLGWF